MQVFGTDLWGLRMLSALVGSLLLLPLYGLTRLWLACEPPPSPRGPLAVSEWAIHSSKLALNNIFTPFWLVLGFFCLFLGLRTGRTLLFVLAGYALMLSLYFYLSGRLTPILLAAVVAYLFLALPLVRLPGTIRHLRRRDPMLSRGEALRQAIAFQLAPLRRYAGPLLACALAAFCLAAPWLMSYLDHRAQEDYQSGKKSVFSEPDRLEARYHLTHDPPTWACAYPARTTPIPFRPSSLSRRRSACACWTTASGRAAFWVQTTRTLSVFTYRADDSGFYPADPATRPLEAALFVLGLAWALWRWRDARFGVLTLWFWLTIVAGGVLKQYVNAAAAAGHVLLAPQIASWFSRITWRTRPRRS